MKKFYSLLAATIISGSVFAQTVDVFPVETMGSPTANTLVNSYTGFVNSGTLTFVGSANTDVRTTNASSGYTGASASGNVLLNNTNKFIEISGIDTRNYKDLVLSFGVRKGTNAITQPVKVEVSTDGTTYSPVTYSNLTTGSGTAGWYFREATSTIPSTANLRIRFTGNDGSNLVNLDDVGLKGSEKLKTDVSSLDFGKVVTSTTSASKTVVVTGDSLDEIPTYAITGTDAGYFTATGTLSLTGGNIAVTFSPSTIGEKTATLTITSGTGISKTVELVGEGEPSLAVSDASKTKANLVKNTIVANELIFGTAGKVSVVNMNGQVVKTAEVSENSRLDVSSLAKGTYVVTAVVNGQTVSQKIIKK